MKKINRFDFSQLGKLPRVNIYVGNEEIDGNCVGRYAIRKAQKVLGFEAVLTVDQQPTVYFKEVEKKDLEAETILHKKLWNHGTANILVVIDPSEVRFYSAFVPPSDKIIEDQNTNTKDDWRIVETLSRDAFILNEFALQVTTGVYYQKYRDRFDFNNSVDQCLLKNLIGAADRLKNTGLIPLYAHTLIGCLLFLFYLWDRKIINASMFPKKLGFSSDVNLRDFLAGEGVSAQTASERLFVIFETIQGKFNGSLFGDNLEATKQSIKTKHLRILQEVISGKTDMASGLTYLFRIYDFDMIPIEMISAIYEGFLTGECNTDNKYKGVFYTPRYLAELTIDVATEKWKTLLDKKYLDPACGSGIFLAILFNRMAEEWRIQNPKAKIKTRLNAFRNFLTENLYGVDISQTSALITCFSLYLAFLDQMESKDIDELQKLLDERQKKKKFFRRF